MHLASSGGRGRKPMERGACVLNVGMKHESPRTASAKSRLPATAALRRAGLLFAFLDLSPRALRHEDTPWNSSAARSTQMSRVSYFHAPRASFAPPHGRPLRVCASAGLSYTQIHRQPRPPRRLAEAQHSANGGWAWVSECAVSRYDAMASF